MSESTQTIEREIARARIDVHEDFEALRRQLNEDRVQIKQKGPMIVAGAAALGLIAGFGGKKAIKWLLVAGIVGGAGAMVAKQRGLI